MLGLVGHFLNDHDENKSHCTVIKETGERVNLQPWFVYDKIDGTKTSPPKEIIYRPANEEDFKLFLKQIGEKKNPIIGELPKSIADEKKRLFDQAMADHAKRNAKEVKQAQA